MIPEIEKRFNDDVLLEVLSRYGVKKEDIKDLGGFESHVYEFARNGKEYILKITHSIRRTENYIMGEVDFVNYLADNGVPVARVVPSVNNKLVEIVPENDDHYFLAYAFEKVYGEDPEGRITDEVVSNIGKAVAKMHALSMKYELPDSSFIRERWNETDLFTNYAEYLPPGSELLEQRIGETLEMIGQYPEAKDSFGLIHGDVHHGNFFVREDDIVLFDFDDLETHYFVSDPAVSLYYQLPRDVEKRKEYADFFLKNFIKGYRTHNDFKKEWLEAMPDFLKLRDVLLAVVIYQAFDFSKINDETRERYLKRIENINNRVPVVDMDFTKYY